MYSCFCGLAGHFGSRSGTCSFYNAPGDDIVQVTDCSFHVRLKRISLLTCFTPPCGGIQNYGNPSDTVQHLRRNVARLLYQVPSAFTISSPSIQNDPSGPVSRFHIGTVCFNVSMHHRQASNASARCGEPTATTTLISPIC